MYGQGPNSVAPVVLLQVIQAPKRSNGKFEPQWTFEAYCQQEHPLLDLLSGMNQGGHTSCWAIFCSVKLNRAMSKKDNKSPLMTLYYSLLTQFQLSTCYQTQLLLFNSKLAIQLYCVSLSSPNWLISLFLTFYALIQSAMSSYKQY